MYQRKKFKRQLSADWEAIEEIECQSSLNATNRCRQKKTWAGASAPAFFDAKMPHIDTKICNSNLTKYIFEYILLL